MPGPRCVVVGVDGSPNSIAALRRAVTEAHRRNAVLDVIHVLGSHDGGPRPLRTVVEWLRLRRLAAREIPRSRRLTARLRVPVGDPGQVLAAAGRRAELLVIGAREHSEHGNPLGGATVPVVLERAACEVVICADHAASRQTA
ncbi:universal stress protein [Actinomadura sp. NPDC047616]|uniref:universal stress protein n=1 Tax=Actinomadura sp. NPDC047616 TaxID=3155914 RepID=UPI00340F9BC7